MTRDPAGQPMPWALMLSPAGRPRAVVMLVLALAVLGAAGSALRTGGDATDARGAGDEGATPAAAEPTGDVVAEAVAADDLPADTTMVWSGSRLADGYADAVTGDPRTGPVSVVRGEILELVRTERADGVPVDDVEDGWWYPVEVLAFDPATYDEVAGRTVVGELDHDEALLSETSAEVRDIGAGGLLEFTDGIRLRVADVVADELIGAAEVATRVDGPLKVETQKYLLARPESAAVHDALLEHGDPEREPRLVPHGSTPVLRHAHSVLPAVQRKAHFGEFTMQDRPGRDIRPGHSWTREHITVESVPILGRVRCHREMFEPLRAAMQELVDRGAEHVISDYAGCWVPRTSGATGPLSSHAWGMSIDFNAPANPYGAEPDQPDLLVEVMAEHGFLWGGHWDVPDAMHFELAPGRETSADPTHGPRGSSP